VLLIVYGATSGATHSHGRIPSNPPGENSIVDSGGTQSSTTGTSRHRECSMCQFQQQLFGGLVQGPLFTRTPSAELAFVSTQAVFLPSTSTTAPSGRAPPLFIA